MNEILNIRSALCLFKNVMKNITHTQRGLHCLFNKNITHTQRSLLSLAINLQWIRIPSILHATSTRSLFVFVTAKQLKIFRRRKYICSISLAN